MLASFVALSLMVAPAAEPPKEDKKKPELSEAAKKELKKLEGKWKVVKAADSKKDGEVTDIEMFFTFEGTKVTLSAKGKDKEEVLEITALDPATDPKCIDLTENVGVAGKTERTLEGVYKIDGDTLVLAFAIPKDGPVRPTGFQRPTDARVLVWTFTRVKE